MSCVFCKIAKKEIKSEIVYENDEVIAFKDVKPITPVHVLIIPKRHIESVADINDADKYLMGELIVAAKNIAEDAEIADDGYKLLFRVKKFGGQEINHMHLHLLGGARLAENIYPVESKRISNKNVNHTR